MVPITKITIQKPVYLLLFKSTEVEFRDELSLHIYKIVGHCTQEKNLLNNLPRLNYSVFYPNYTF